MGFLYITSTYKVNEDAIEIKFIQSSGPGGQNVNKVATAAQLRFNIAELPFKLHDRFIKLAGKKINQQGDIVITARRFRSQDRNRQDAIERLVGLIRQAAWPVKKRQPTKPSLAEKRRRLQSKQKRSHAKTLRAKIKCEE